MSSGWLSVGTNKAQQKLVATTPHFQATVLSLKLHCSGSLWTTKASDHRAIQGSNPGQKDWIDSKHISAVSLRPEIHASGDQAKFLTRPTSLSELVAGIMSSAQNGGSWEFQVPTEFKVSMECNRGRASGRSCCQFLSFTKFNIGCESSDSRTHATSTTSRHFSLLG